MFESKVAIITGASRGIGKQIAITLAKNGCDVVINYQHNQTLAEEVANEIRKYGNEPLIMQADVSDAEQVEQLIKMTIKRFGKIDFLVNNAGVTRDNLIMRMKEEDWDQVISTNLKSVFLLSKAIARPMLKQKSGRIVNLTSVVGIIGNAGQSNYAAAKAGIIGLTKSLAREFASRGITVNAVAPGFIETDMTSTLPQEVKEGLLAQIPLAKFGQAEDVANVVKFLLSEDASYITGQVLNVDGGMVMY